MLHLHTYEVCKLGCTKRLHVSKHGRCRNFGNNMLDSRKQEER